VSIVDEIAAIRSNDLLSADQKRVAVYDLKGAAVVAALASRVGQTFTRGNFALTLTAAPTYSNNRLTFPAFTLTRNGVPLLLDLPLHIVNPPLMVPDGVGGFTLNPLQAIRDVIMGLVR
jgi:hypothetical protein